MLYFHARYSHYCGVVDAVAGFSGVYLSQIHTMFQIGYVILHFTINVYQFYAVDYLEWTSAFPTENRYSPIVNNIQIQIRAHATFRLFLLLLLLVFVVLLCVKRKKNMQQKKKQQHIRTFYFPLSELNQRISMAWRFIFLSFAFFSPKQRVHSLASVTLSIVHYV